ncbi:MAG: hypothetical protein NTW38_08625 [Candidatus Aminicenantes bacterium]|nr:hypothetical protein [Candidatus Aminicenantes bacterium]
MKKTLAVLIAVAGLAPAALCDSGNWMLRISGGPAWISPDDLNTFLRDYVRIQESEAGSSARGPGLKTVGLSANFEAALFIPIEPRIHLLVSFGSVRAATTGNEFVVAYPAVDAAYTRDDRIRSYIGRLGIACSWPISARLNLRPYAAAEGYWTTFEDTGSWSYTSLSTGEKILWMDWTVRTRAFNPGFSAGLELDGALSSLLRLSIDAGYRRAKLTGFKGDFHNTWNFPGGGFSDDREDRPLYYYEYEDAGHKPGYGTLKMPDIWGGRRLTLIRDAVIDLSGLYLKAGLSVSF